MSTHLVWFRADLRIHDNPALAAACASPQAQVMALFIATPGQWQQHDMSPRQASWLNQHVNSLQSALAQRGIPLLFEEVNDFSHSVDTMKILCEKHQVSHLFYNYQYEINERRRDAAVEAALPEVICQGFDGSVMLAPGSVSTGSNTMYKVFTPFKNAFLRRLKEDLPECVAAPNSRKTPLLDKTLPVRYFNYPQHPIDDTQFPMDELAALAQLKAFCQQQAATYEQTRDFPAFNGTSRLSACLTIGVLSPRQCLHYLLHTLPDVLEGGRGFVWFNELIWREFYRHLLVAWPSLCCHRPFIAWTDKIQWRQDEVMLNAWQQGKTGYPCVDAGMRQLNATGWMHNRLRMIVASFLVKDLLIDWRSGERYFMSQLIDGDLAANNGGWQWAASTGTDAVPYFRIFNPTTQGMRFDPDGEFIRYWLPELATVPGKAIHAPWEWADKQKITLDYPRPVVDHKTARCVTLAAWEAARQ